MTSLFKKRKNLNVKNVRVVNDDEDNFENQNDSLSISNNLKKYPFDARKVNPSQVSCQAETHVAKKDNEKKKSKEKGKTKITVLSFEDELEADDGIAFQEKKSSLSYKLRKEMKKERKEKKREEKGKSRSQAPISISDLDELGIKIVNGREAEAIAAVPGDSDESDQDVSRPKSNYNENINLQPWKAALQSGKIPDADLIHQIRKERQKAREREAIPIDETIRLDEHKSRLIREDDNDHSDDDESRIKFSVNLDDVDRKQRREVFEAAQEDETEQEAEWELQQLKNAGATAKITEEIIQDCGFNSGISGSYSASGLASSGYPYRNDYSFEPAFGIFDTAVPNFTVPLERPVNYQAEGIIKRLRDSRDSLDEVLRRHRSEADNIIDDLVGCKTTIAKCNSEQDPLTESFKFYQDMRGYVTDLRECLNEKLGEVKRLEQQVYLIYRQNSQKMMQRRRQDVKDQNDEFSPFAGKLAKGDEYRVRRAAEREGRRTRRRRERERRGETKHHDGMSTDDEESHLDSQRMQSELESVAAESKKVFEDVEDDFSVIEKVMSRFQDWKSIDTTSYMDAYVSFNLPKLFSPYIYLQLLMWNPLRKEDPNLDIEKTLWFSTLSAYGIQLAGQDSLDIFRMDPDRRLMSHIVEKVVLPKVKELVSCFWDPLSHVQSVRLVNLMRHFTTSYPSIGPNSRQLRELTQAIIARIKDCIDNDIFIPMFPISVYESRTSGVSLFFQRQFWSSWKLLGSVLMWHHILSDPIIHELAIRSLLNLYLLPALNLAAEISIKDALEKTRHVINVLPREWCKYEGGTHPFLGRLENFLVTLSSKLELPTNAVEITEICDLLKAFGARQQAHSIASKYL